MYVNDFKNIISNTTVETKLLNYAQNNGLNYIILYNLTYENSMFSVDNTTTSLPIENFINTAKTSYEMSQVAVVGEKKNSSFNRIKIYNSFYPIELNKQFDVFNLEF